MFIIAVAKSPDADAESFTERPDRPAPFPPRIDPKTLASEFSELTEGDRRIAHADLEIAETRRSGPLSVSSS